MNYDNISTPSKRKIEALGFQFSDIEVTGSSWEFGGLFRGTVNCPCGKTEKFLCRIGMAPSEVELEYIYETLYRVNFNEKHLRDDGFPEDFIQQCKLKYEG